MFDFAHHRRLDRLRRVPASPQLERFIRVWFNTTAATPLPTRQRRGGDDDTYPFELLGRMDRPGP